MLFVRLLEPVVVRWLVLWCFFKPAPDRCSAIEPPCSARVLVTGPTRPNRPRARCAQACNPQGPATRAKHRSSRFQGLTKFRQSLRAAATACVACLFGLFVVCCFRFVVLCCSGNQDRRSSGCTLSPPAFGLSQADPHLPGCGDRPSRAEQTCMLEQSPPSMQHACIPWLVGWSGFGWCGWLSPTALLSLFQLARWSLEMANGYE